MFVQIVQNSRISKDGIKDTYSQCQHLVVIIYDFKITYSSYKCMFEKKSKN